MTACECIFCIVQGAWLPYKSMWDASGNGKNSILQKGGWNPS